MPNYDFPKNVHIEERLKHFKKVPMIELPHGMKNILYRAHRNDANDQITKKELSLEWHRKTST